jgi:hypothetical protein
LQTNSSSDDERAREKAKKEALRASNTARNGYATEFDELSNDHRSYKVYLFNFKLGNLHDLPELNVKYTLYKSAIHPI